MQFTMCLILKIRFTTKFDSLIIKNTFYSSIFKIRNGNMKLFCMTYRQKSHFCWGKNKNKGKHVITKLTGMENKNRHVKKS